MSGITTHVLDTALGRPAAGLSVRLERLAGDGSAQALAERTTNADGRVSDLSQDVPLRAGVYRLVFDTGPYFAQSGRVSFYPRVELLFEVRDESQHHHVPLLLSPFGYTTYRGS